VGAPVSNVGSYAITQGGVTNASNSNYAISYTDGSLSVAPASLVLVADAKSKLFGAIDPALTFSTTGLVNNPGLGITDTPASVLSGALIRVPGETAAGGPYAITQGSLLANGNYMLSYAPGSLVIIGAAAVPVVLNTGRVVFVGVTNSEYYYRPGNFWHISLNSNHADPGFDVMRGTEDSNTDTASDGAAQLSGFIGGPRRRNVSCGSVMGGGFCETWSFPQQFDRVEKK
jgi:hypothetical protein